MQSWAGAGRRQERCGPATPRARTLPTVPAQLPRTPVFHTNSCAFATGSLPAPYARRVDTEHRDEHTGDDDRPVPDQAGTDVDDALVDAALDASRALLGAVARSLAGALEQVSLPQFRVLVLLTTRGGQRSGDLARAVGVHPSTFSRSADRLVTSGWVRRAENPDSRREVLVELTPQGAALVAEVTRRRRDELATVLGRVDPDQRTAVRDALRAYAVAAEESAGSDLLTLGV